MEKFIKSRSELEDELRDQMQAMRSSAAGYDAGNIWEAKRLASSLYILLHDGTGRTKSLLGMLGLKKILLLSSMPDDKLGKLIGSFGGKLVSRDATPLLIVQISETGSKYLPTMGDCPGGVQFKEMTFSKWYEENLFYAESRIKLARKNMIFTARSQDGGAHVDPHITDTSYREFSVDGDPFTKTIPGGLGHGPGVKGDPIKNGTWAIIRQIVWEVDQTLQAVGIVE